MEWSSSHIIESLLIIGFILLIVEIVVLGFSTFVLLFVGLAAILTSGLIYIGFIDETLINAVLCTSVISVLAAIFLWKPFKGMQSNVSTTQVTNDLIGHSFILSEPVSSTLTPNYHYSGIDWKLMSDDNIDTGAKVEVDGTDVGIFHIKEK